jgi:hypothetical protein
VPTKTLIPEAGVDNARQHYIAAFVLLLALILTGGAYRAERQREVRLERASRSIDSLYLAALLTKVHTMSDPDLRMIDSLSARHGWSDWTSPKMESRRLDMNINVMEAALNAGDLARADTYRGYIDRAQTISPAQRTRFQQLRARMERAQSDPGLMLRQITADALEADLRRKGFTSVRVYAKGSMGRELELINEYHVAGLIDQLSADPSTFFQIRSLGFTVVRIGVVPLPWTG